MEMKEILSDIQRSIDDLQQKLNLLRGVQTGTLYDVDVAHAVRQIPLLPCPPDSKGGCGKVTG